MLSAVPPTDSAMARLRYARRSLADRRARGRFFNDRMFGEAAWDVMLDLYVAYHEQALISVYSLCIAAAVPETTALRHIKWLIEDGIIERFPDPNDGRRAFARLTDNARMKMDTLIDHCPRTGASLNLLQKLDLA